LNKITVNKEPTLKEVKIAQFSQESIPNKNYEALKQQLAALSNVVSSIQQQPHQYIQQHNQANTNEAIHHSDKPSFSPMKCFHCEKTGHSFRKCFTASEEDVNRISKELANKKKSRKKKKKKNNEEECNVRKNNEEECRRIMRKK